jgi:hypothetical protein
MNKLSAKMKFVLNQRNGNKEQTQNGELLYINYIYKILPFSIGFLQI